MSTARVRLITFDIPASPGSIWGRSSWDAVVGEKIPLFGETIGTLRKAEVAKDGSSVRLTVELPEDLYLGIEEILQ